MNNSLSSISPLAVTTITLEPALTEFFIIALALLIILAIGVEVVLKILADLN
jgi:hypothetical protein